MNEKRIHELIGRIRDKDRDKVSTGKWAGSYFYRLNVEIENKEVKVIFAFKDKLDLEQVWKDIEQSNYIDKRYLFYCEKGSKGYALRNWKELLNSFSERAKELSNHGSN